jgi:hypothetical protein
MSWFLLQIETEPISKLQTLNSPFVFILLDSMTKYWTKYDYDQLQSTHTQANVSHSACIFRIILASDILLLLPCESTRTIERERERMRANIQRLKFIYQY